jgi:hypothetical protein
VGNFKTVRQNILYNNNNAYKFYGCSYLIVLNRSCAVILYIVRSWIVQLKLNTSIMKLIKQPETESTIIIVVSSIEKPELSKKPKINPSFLKAISLIVITLISWLNPEATIAIAVIKLLFILLEWLNQNQSKK